QIRLAKTPLEQGLHQQVCGCYGVLNREVDSDSSGRRHGVCRISNAQEARQVPSRKPIDLYGEDLDLIPVLYFVDSLAQIGSDPANIGAESFEATRFDVVIRAFCDDEARLEI